MMSNTAKAVLTRWCSWWGITNDSFTSEDLNNQTHFRWMTIWDTLTWIKLAEVKILQHWLWFGYRVVMHIFQKIQIITLWSRCWPASYMVASSPGTCTSLFFYVKENTKFKVCQGALEQGTEHPTAFGRLSDPSLWHLSIHNAHTVYTVL